MRCMCRTLFNLAPTCTFERRTPKDFREGGPRTRLVNLTGKRKILSKTLWLILSFPLQFPPIAISTRGFDLDCHATCLLDKHRV